MVLRTVACLDDRCYVFLYGYYGGAVSNHGNGVGKGDTSEERSSLVFFLCVRAK